MRKTSWSISLLTVLFIPVSIPNLSVGLPELVTNGLHHSSRVLHRTTLPTFSVAGATRVPVFRCVPRFTPDGGPLRIAYPPVVSRQGAGKTLACVVAGFRSRFDWSSGARRFPAYELQENHLPDPLNGRGGSLTW